MDDVIKKLIYNSKLILFMHQPYIIKPYMCYLQSLSSLYSPRRLVRKSKKLLATLSQIAQINKLYYFVHLSVHEYLNYNLKPLVQCGQFSSRKWVLNSALALKQQFPFSLIIQSASKFGCLAVYLRGDCARKDCVVFVSDICNFQR